MDIIQYIQCGYWQVQQEVRDILRICDVPARYYYRNLVRVEKEELVATDGRVLVRVLCDHDIRPGYYYMTWDGFLLPHRDKQATIPDHTYLFEGHEKLMNDTELSRRPSGVLDRICYVLACEGIAVPVRQVQHVVDALIVAMCRDLSVFRKKDSDIFLISGDCVDWRCKAAFAACELGEMMSR